MFYILRSKALGAVIRARDTLCTRRGDVTRGVEVTLSRIDGMIWCEPGVGGALRHKVAHMLAVDLYSGVIYDVNQPLGAGGVTITTHVTLLRSTLTHGVTADRVGGVGEEGAKVS